MRNVQPLCRHTHLIDLKSMIIKDDLLTEKGAPDWSRKQLKRKEKYFELSQSFLCIQSALHTSSHKLTVLPEVQLEQKELFISLPEKCGFFIATKEVFCLFI